MSLLALQTGFLCLDLCRVEEAREWFAECTAHSATALTHERRVALAQLHARILLASGDYRGAAEILLPLRSEILHDPLARRRCAGAASLAVALSDSSERDDCLALVAIAKSVLEAETPSLQLDFPCEAIARALIAHGLAEESRTIMLSYLERRDKFFPRELAPAFTLLREAATDAKPLRS